MRWERNEPLPRRIVDAEADFILALKKNQEGLYKEVTEYVDQHMQTNFEGVGARRFDTTETKHGRDGTPNLCLRCLRQKA